MDSQVYSEHIEQEEVHWWFVARRKLTGHLLDTIKIPSNAKILDAGCGAGGNLGLLSNHGQVFGFEMNDQMREHTIKRNIGAIAYGKLPGEIPFAESNFDLITMFDVLEHVEDDSAALLAVAARLNKDGVLFLTVPAFQFLFSRHDRMHHHFRRYGKAQLKEKIKAAGLKIEYCNYWNVILFPVAIAVRLLDFMFSENRSVAGARTPKYLINSLLIKLISAERFVMEKMPFPYGLSLILIARKI